MGGGGDLGEMAPAGIPRTSCAAVSHVPGWENPDKFIRTQPDLESSPPLAKDALWSCAILTHWSRLLAKEPLASVTALRAPRGANPPQVPTPSHQVPSASSPNPEAVNKARLVRIPWAHNTRGLRPTAGPKQLLSKHQSPSFTGEALC